MYKIDRNYKLNIATEPEVSTALLLISDIGKYPEIVAPVTNTLTCVSQYNFSIILCFFAVHCSIITQHKPTRSTFSKLIF